MAAVIAAGLGAIAAPPARAQIASAPPAAAPGWSFAVTPYSWLPTISADYAGSGPRGGSVSTSVSAGIGEYLSDINFTMMIGAQARYDRFSLLTDFVYLNASLTGSTTHLSKLNVGAGPVDIPRDTQLGTGSRAANAIWNLAGGYTVLQGDWGYLDVLAGFRMLTFNATTNYQLSVDVPSIDRTVILPRGTGSVTTSRVLMEGIGGLTGRIAIPNSKFYLPFYVDVGGGSAPFTWQIYGGVGYAATSWLDLSAGYRYLSFQDGDQKGVRDLSLGGALIVANIRF